MNITNQLSTSAFIGMNHAAPANSVRNIGRLSNSPITTPARTAAPREIVAHAYSNEGRLALRTRGVFIRRVV